MAKSKKKSKPAARTPATKSAKKTASKPASRRAAPKRLDASARASMLKPGDSLNELIHDVLVAWALVKKKVRVADVSPASLTSLGKKAAKAVQRENDLAAKQAAKLAPLSDARMIANDAAYRAALKVKRIAHAVAATDPDVADAFASVTGRFRTGGGAEPAAPTPPA